MRGGQPDPGRGVYVARRIVVALVILLLLILFVPRACEALFSEGESDTGALETAATDEDTVAEQVSITDESPNDGEIDAEDGTGGDTGSAEAGEDENVEGLNTEIAVDLTAVFMGPEPIVEESDIANDAGIEQEAPPPPSVDDQQQAVQPVTQPPLVQPATQQPVVQPPPVQPVAQQPAVQPVVEGPTLFQEPFFFEEPAFFQEPVFFGGPALFQEPVFLGEPLVVQENGGNAVGTMVPDDTGVVADSAGAVAVTGTVTAIS